MYTILVKNTNELFISVKERIMQRSKLVDDLHFLVEPIYKGLDMTEYTVLMEYILPVSKQYKSEILVLSEEKYKEMLEYKIPFNTDLTSEAGDIEVQLTFVKTDLDTEGNGVQYVRKTTPTIITIIPLSAWSDIIPDTALNAIDQKLLKVDAQIKALTETGNMMAVTKADNIVLDSETHELYLTANGEAIGDKILMDDVTEVIIETKAAESGIVPVII